MSAPLPKAILRRQPSSDEGTFGVLSFGGQTVYSLELPWRDNRRQKSCIPFGSYRCTLVQSPKFGRVYEVTNVPGRSAVLIHPANFGGDADLGYTTHLQGCIAPCERIGLMQNKAGRMQRAGLVSRPAVSRLMSWAAGQPFELEIL
jgi:hypothetical protein